jgi:hypothetical protein
MGVRLLFGAIGLAVALLAALGMNALFDALNTRALLAGTRVLLFDTEDEVVERLQEAGAQFGDPQFSLAWNNRNDLDLHVIDPAGNHIWYRQRTSPTGGELDVDANADRLRTTERPVENIYWPPANAPEGVYTVYVHHYANHGAPDPTPYTLRITIDGRTREFQGSLRHGEQSQQMSIDPRAVDDWYPLPAKRMGWAFVVMGAWGAALGLVLALGLRLPQAFFKRHEAYDPREFGVGRIVGRCAGRGGAGRAGRRAGAGAVRLVLRAGRGLRAAGRAGAAGRATGLRAGALHPEPACEPRALGRGNRRRAGAVGIRLGAATLLGRHRTLARRRAAGACHRADDHAHLLGDAVCTRALGRHDSQGATQQSVSVGGGEVGQWATIALRYHLLGDSNG